jgi:hypothetical protein
MQNHCKMKVSPQYSLDKLTERVMMGKCGEQPHERSRRRCSFRNTITSWLEHWRETQSAVLME